MIYTVTRDFLDKMAVKKRENALRGEHGATDRYNRVRDITVCRLSVRVFIGPTALMNTHKALSQIRGELKKLNAKS